MRRKQSSILAEFHTKQKENEMCSKNTCACVECLHRNENSFSMCVRAY